MASDSAGPTQDRLGDILLLLRSMDARMERREQRELAKDRTMQIQVDGGTTPAGEPPNWLTGLAEGATTTLEKNESVAAAKSSQSIPAANWTSESHDENDNQPAIVDGESVTVVGQLSRIVDALKDVGLIRSERREEEQTSPLRQSRFGLNLNKSRRGNEDYDYTLKYDEDEDLKELSEEARVFWVYNDEAKVFDDDMVAELGDGLDLSIIFSALFSAVVTTFVVETSQSLSPPADDPDETKEATSQFHAASVDLWINGLWFVSLTLSLAVALFAVLAKQWLRQYMSIVTGTPRERSFIRQFRYDGLMKWRVPTIVGIIPVILHLSVLLFIAGLTVFLAPLSRPLAWIIGGVTIVIIMLYVVTTVLPLVAHQCPYRTTFTDLIYHLLRVLRVLWTREIREPQTDSFDAVEREAAAPPIRTEADQNAELRALSWLAKTSSSPSAKTIVFESIGAFHPKMTEGILEVKQGLYGLDTISRAETEMYNLVAHPRVTRALLHCRSLFAEQSTIRYNHSYSDIDSYSVPAAQIITNLAAGFNIEFMKDRHMMYPSEGLAWACKFWEDSDSKVPELVWASLCRRATRWGLPVSIPLGKARQELLTSIKDAKWGIHASPRCLGDDITMEDVAWELDRRICLDYWKISATKWLDRWNVEDRAAIEERDKERVRDFMKSSRRLGPPLHSGWEALAEARLATESDADESCYAKWEEGARGAFAVLLSLTQNCDSREGTSWTERLTRLDLESDISDWKAYKAQMFQKRLREKLESAQSKRRRKRNVASAVGWREMNNV